tara:strand:- start:18603 stop:18719 length:117 start_codon:yes stop_codon:yes gene_type:complete
MKKKNEIIISDMKKKLKTVSPVKTKKSNGSGMVWIYVC